MQATGVKLSGTVDRVKESIDIVDIISEYLPLRKAGNNFVGLCPFHSEKTASFSVNQEKQFFHCFGCGASGDVISFIMKNDGMDFKDALAKLAFKAGIDLPQLAHKSYSGNNIAEINNEAAHYFNETLKNNNSALNYLFNRGINNDCINYFNIGYSTDAWNDLTAFLLKKFDKESLIKSGISVISKNLKLYDRFRSRIMIPIISRNIIVGFGGRLLTKEENQAKYVNTAKTEIFNKGNLLFGLDKARSAIIKKSYVVICEGYFDMISLYENGITNSVATLGTALSEFHIAKLKRLTNRFYLCYDSDSAGIKAAYRSIPMMLKNGIAASIVTLSNGKDPDSFVRENGKELFLKRIKGAQEAFDFWVESLIKSASTVSERAIIWNKITPLLNEIDDTAIRQTMINRAGQLLGISYSPANFHTIGKVKKADLLYQEKLLLSLLLSNQSFLEQVTDDTVSALSKLTGCIIAAAKKNEGQLSKIIEMLDKQSSDIVCSIVSENLAGGLNALKSKLVFDECIAYFETVKKRHKRSNIISKIKSAALKGDSTTELIKQQQELMSNR